MNKNQEMLELERTVFTASSQINTICTHLMHDYNEMPLNAQDLVQIIKEKSEFIKNSTERISCYLEFEVTSWL